MVGGILKLDTLSNIIVIGGWIGLSDNIAIWYVWRDFKIIQTIENECNFPISSAITTKFNRIFSDII